MHQGCNAKNQIRNYNATPYADSVYSKGAQLISGKLQCEYYDSDGAGIAFHDNDSINSVSGRLNPADSVAWRLWHHWNCIPDFARIYLKKGLQTFTIHSVESGQMNYDFIDFQRGELK